MRKKTLLRVNVLICITIVLGFIITSYISYNSNRGIFKQDVEHISRLTSEGIFYQIDSIFSKPIHISLTMANDSLLKDFLAQETEAEEDEEFLATMRNYLASYKTQYNYDSVFLVSTDTSRYYHYEAGIDRILTEDNPENEWYYDFLETSKEYNLNVDNDEAISADNEINIFINCKIFSPEGEVMGVVGVGFQVDAIQEMFREYEEKFEVRAWLLNDSGTIEVSTAKTGYEKENFFSNEGLGGLEEKIYKDKEQTQSFWYHANGREGFYVSCYVPSLEWYLVINRDTTGLEQELHRQIATGCFVVILVIGMVLLVVTWIIRTYNEQLVKLTMEKEKAHRNKFQEETEKLYENIYEIDISHNCGASEVTLRYFESLGAPEDMPYDEVLKIIAQKQVKEEFRKEYIRTFSTKNVMRAYEEGRDSLQYEFMMTNDDGNTWYWMRIMARIFYWQENESVRMLIYRQNISEEKQRESNMMEKLQRDSLTGLYNKAATQHKIQQLMYLNQGKTGAFFMLDIDRFKTVNDTCGHAVGDLVITEFSQRIRKQFRAGDVVGRVGGDEFAVFFFADTKEQIEAKADSLVKALNFEFADAGRSCKISSSIGVAISPQAGTDFEMLYKNADSALYKAKKQGRNGYAIF